MKNNTESQANRVGMVFLDYWIHLFHLAKKKQVQIKKKKLPNLQGKYIAEIIKPGPLLYDQ